MNFFGCSNCGFNNAILFERISEHDICAVENFVREELLDIIKSNSEVTAGADDVLLEDQLLKDNFGELYMLNPSKFRFQAGDRKFIQLVIDHIRLEIKKKGRKRALHHFGYKIDQPKKAKLTINKIVEGSDCTDLFDMLKTKLFDQVLQKLKAHYVPESILNIFDKSFVKVDISENNDITGDVTCIVCYAQSEDPESIKPKSVFCRSKSGIKSWIISNFDKHLKRAHSNKQNCTEKDPVELNDKLSYAPLNEDNNNDNVEINKSAYNFSYGSLELSNEFDGDEFASKEKIFNKQIGNQIIRMWNVATINGECLENVQCEDDNNILCVDVVEIPKDGNCLFSTIAHQLYGNDINSAEHEIATKNLRASVIKYIQQNYDDFVYELRGHVYDLKDLDESHEIHNIDNIEDACKYLLNKHLVLPGTWGGAETLKAITFMHNVNIIVFNENGPVYAIINGEQNTERSITVAYRLGSGEQQIRNHYDSVCNISADDIYKTAKIITKALSQSQNVVTISETLN